ncbi:hypothetical protein B0H10DRAFT_2096372 [Mycena sp. CBHHK59/15]|nr:hypothetical protein B0H10DRAFT_2096372 [Mycena sp. CBHHK59/15]
MTMPAQTSQYWQTLLADYSKTAFGESSTLPWRHATVSRSWSLRDFETVRLVLVVAWSIVLSKHTGSKDILVGEVVTLDGQKTTVPRRLQLSGSGPAFGGLDQLAAQLSADPVNAASAGNAVTNLLESDPYYSFIELHPDSRQVSSTPTSINDTIHLDVSSDSVTLHFPDTFVSADMQYMIDHLVQIVHQAIRDEKLLAPEMPMIDTQERAFMLNLPTCSVDSASEIMPKKFHYRYGHDLLAHSLATRPNAVAVEWEGQPRYTYAQLEAASNQLCRYLVHELHVRPKDVVIIVAEYSPFVVVAIYALLKAGATYLPLDVEMPEDRLQHVVSMVDAKLLLTIEGLQQRLDSVSPGRTVVCIDTAAAKWESLDGSQVDNQLLLGDPDTSLAYVNLTSGSTGLPKGCMISHTNLVRWVVEASPMFETNSASRYFQLCKLQFDGIVLEIFKIHYVGGTLCMASAFSLESNMQEVMNSMRITGACITPTLSMVLDPKKLPFLRYLVVTGEPLTRFARERWLEQGVCLQNCYGPTESVCGFTLESPVHSSMSNRTPVGFSLGTTRTYVLDSALRPVGVGCIGEICVSGPTVGLGYYGEPEKTAAAFVNDPFRPGFRMYRTGDSGRVNHEGRLFFIGRTDSQVKLHGNRIELGEIESVLATVQGHWKSCVELVEYQGGPHIIAFIAPALSKGSGVSLQIDDKAKAVATALLAAVNSKLLKQMIPTLFVPVAALPRTISGKIDRKMLQTFFRGLSVEETGAIADMLVERGAICPPTSDLERELHDLWSTTLSIPPSRFGIHDSFNTLGVDSLSVVRLSNALRNDGFNLSPVQLRALKTIAHAAATILSPAESSSAVSEAAPSISLLHEVEVSLVDSGIPPSSVEDVIPATPFQRGVLLHPSGFMSAISFVLDRKIDIKKMCASLKALAAAHPILRTAFLMATGTKSFKSCLKMPGSVHGVSDSTSGSAAKTFARFEWGHCPYHPVVLYNSQGPSELVMFIHHGLYDGVAMRSLMSDLIRLYDGDQLPARTPWQTFVRHVCTEKPDSVTFWRSYLADVRSSPFCRPGKYPRGTKPAELRKTRAFEVDLTKSISALQVPDSVLMYAAWALVQFIHTSDKDVLFAVVSSGRDFHTLSGLLKAVEAAMVASHDHQHFGANRAFQAAGHKGIMSNVEFVLQNLDSNAEKSWIYARENTIADQSGVPLVIEVGYSSDRSGFTVLAAYDTSAVLDAEVDCMMDRFACVVRAMLDNLNTEVDAANFLVPGEAASVVLKDEAASTSSSSTITTLELFLSRVRGSPLSLAVDVDGAGGLTYSQLDVRSSQRASEFFNLGVRPGEVVLVQLDKGVELVVSIVACLKGGFCFCVSSPDCSPDRMRFLTETVKPGLLVSMDSSPRPGIRIAWSPSDASLEGASSLMSFSDPGPDSWAYIVLTSGTTGRPKAIAITRSNLDALLNDVGFAHHRPGQRSLQFSSVNFDVFIFDLLGNLSNGGCLCFTSTANLHGQLAHVIRRMKIHTVDITPTVASLLVDEKFDTLRTIILGGEGLLSMGIEQLQSAYGPAECTVQCFRHLVGQESAENPSQVSLGNIFGRNIGLVVDSKLRPVPFGSTGELLIGGPQVGWGYVGQPELTAKTFIPVTLPSGETMRMYRTGDLVRLVPDRTLQFISRVDRQVKIRGIRVVEAAIRNAAASVTSVVVAPVTGATGARELAAFIVVSKTSSVDTSALLQTLRARLLEYTATSVRNHLRPEPIVNASRVGDEPSSPEIELVRSMWSKVLNKTDIELDVPFSDIGGDSFKWMQLSLQFTRAKKRVTLPALVQASTVRAQAKLLG